MMFLQVSFPVTDSSTSRMCLNAERLNLQYRDADAVSITWKYCCWYSSSGVLLHLSKTGLSKPKSSPATVMFSQNSVNTSQRAFMSFLSVSVISLALFMRFKKKTSPEFLQVHKQSIGFTLCITFLNYGPLKNQSTHCSLRQWIAKKHPSPSSASDTEALKMALLYLETLGTRQAILVNF